MIPHKGLTHPSIIQRHVSRFCRSHITDWIHGIEESIVVQASESPRSHRPGRMAPRQLLLLEDGSHTRLVTSIAYHISIHTLKLKKRELFMLQLWNVIFIFQLSLDAQFSALVCSPSAILLKLGTSCSNDYIDGLDECGDSGAQE